MNADETAILQANPNDLSQQINAILRQKISISSSQQKINIPKKQVIIRTKSQGFLETEKPTILINSVQDGIKFPNNFQNSKLDSDSFTQLKAAYKSKHTFSKKQSHKSNSFLDRNDTFLTQIEQANKTKEVQIVQDHTPTKIFTTQKVAQIESVYSTPPLATPSILSPKVEINLSKYDFQHEANISCLSSRLRSMLHHSNYSAVVHALCGSNLSHIPRAVLLNIIKELRLYLDQCVKKSLLGEAEYVQWSIDNVQHTIAESKIVVDQKPEQYQNLIQQSERQLKKRIEQYVSLFFNSESNKRKIGL